MRPPGNAAEAIPARAKAERAVEKLEQKPPAEKQHRGQNEKRAENEWRDDRLDTGMGKESKVGAHHAGDGATRPNRRHLRTEVGVNVHQRGRDAARQIERQESSAPKPVLDVVAKNPERPHVASQMEPAAMKEHGAEEGTNLFAETEEMGEVRVRIANRNDRQLHKGSLQSSRPELQFPEKNERVDRDDGQCCGGKSP